MIKKERNADIVSSRQNALHAGIDSLLVTKFTGT